MATIFQGSVGVVIEITLGSDISGTNGVSYLVEKPNGTTATWTATVDSATTGVTHYTLQSADISQAGTYRLQPKVTFASPAQTYYGDIVEFTVEETIV